jgi:hypothetical protein
MKSPTFSSKEEHKIEEQVASTLRDESQNASAHSAVDKKHTCASMALVTQSGMLQHCPALVANVFILHP